MDWAAILRRALFGLGVFVAANALVAGPLLLVRPDGSLLGLDQAEWRHRAFDSFVVPGLLLTGLGLAQAVAAALQWRRRPKAWFWSGFAAGYLVVWIAVQVALVKPSFLQPLLLAIGLVQGALALGQWRLGQVAARPATLADPGRR